MRTWEMSDDRVESKRKPPQQRIDEKAAAYDAKRAGLDPDMQGVVIDGLPVTFIEEGRIKAWCLDGAFVIGVGIRWCLMGVGTFTVLLLALVFVR